MIINGLVGSAQSDVMRGILKEITQKISEEIIKKESGNGLLNGLAGYILFLYNAGKFEDICVDDSLLNEKMELLQAQLAKQSLEFSSGLAGQAWLLEFLNQSNKADYDSELLESIDILFANSLSQNDVWLGEIETILGLAGYTPYTARRARFTDQTRLYSIIVRAFEQTATYFDNGNITWSQPYKSAYRFNQNDENLPEYNLGLAHGVPGIIAALVPVLHIPKLKARARKLLLGSCDWLLTNQNCNLSSNACFGSCAGDGGDSRLGWCYGDLTIALTLMRVGVALNMPHYVERALGIARHAAKRDEISGYVKDAGICHGYFGLIMIFSLLNKLSPHPDLQAAINYWLSFALEQYEDNGVSSFYSYKGDEGGYEEDFSLLMGYSGIGLVILSLLNGEFGWADSLLID
ncbi:lantibiotic biosynthesis protein [Pseudoalteromonas sp. 20-92]|uniref:Lantibiotic biosynthesis protein n=1 Tax=Pseudoalteromonas fuliginea TaxID=1872678 RepID=A0AB73BLU2_9GAMM|nr:MULTISPECIES: lanthionine synthetase LanC family protein [Pseudoalteromonas]KAA1165812.1 lantibiotic biosynthesis protein [Pseudoalteromonas fuliginea]MDQ2046011.1 lantibiotic biosynthesis protein [Pseudoalteromonas sp. 20-92]